MRLRLILRSLSVLVFAAHFPISAATFGSDHERSLKINKERKAWVPSPRNDYQLLQQEEQLYVVWDSPEKQRLRLFLSRIDLSDFQIEESIQFPLPEMDGDQVAPSVVFHEGRLEMAWVVGSGRGQNRVFFIHFGSFVPGEEQIDLEKTERYGVFLGVPQIVSTERGLFTVGISQEKDDKGRQLRLYRRDEGPWETISTFFDPETTNADPVLVEHQDRLFLFWVRNGRLVYTTSEDGSRWGEPEVLAEGWNRSLVVRALEDRLEVSWLEVGPSSSKVRWTASSDGGKTWPDAESVEEIPAVRGEIQFFPPEESTVLLVKYWDSNQQTDVVQSVVRNQDGWQETHINPFFRGAGRVPFWDSLLRNERLTIFWHQGLRRGNGIYRNDSQEPFTEWLEEPQRVDPEDPKLRRSAPRLLAWENQLFYIYYQYEKTFVMAARANNRGDLILERIEEGESSSAGSEE